MNIKDVFLDGNELGKLYWNCRIGLVSLSDLSETQKKQLLKYANEINIHELRFMNELLMANPGTTLEYWKNNSLNYRDSKKIIEWLTKEPDKITPPPRKPQTFEGLFRDKQNAQKVIDILEKKEYILNKHWQGLTNDKSELLCAYYVLKPILKPGRPTPQGRIFYREFGLDEGYMSNRMMTNEPDDYNNSRVEFKRIFSHLIPK